jgi:hypothetical protein
MNVMREDAGSNLVSDDFQSAHYSLAVVRVVGLGVKAMANPRKVTQKVLVFNSLPLPKC